MKIYFVGIDIGSTCTKAVVMTETKEIIKSILQPTGWSSVDTAENILSKLNSEGITRSDSVIVATGYGRVSVPNADKCVTEITCHARGASHIYGMDELLVIDIGGQDTKIISVEGGTVNDFIMNDKCSAGTGRFLEIMSNTLSVSPEQLCVLASHGGGTSISSMCTVFAESEVISLIGRGEKRENIAYAVVDSIVRKVASQANKMQPFPECICLTGGLCGFPYIRASLSNALKYKVIANESARYAGAAGAALIAMNQK